MENLTKEYLRNGNPFKAVDSAGLQVGEGDLIVITGASGSGKSTFFYMLAGMLRPTSGSARFLGRELGAAGDRELARIRRTDIGYIQQGNSLLRNYTALENVCLPMTLSGSRAYNRTKAENLIEQFNLSAIMNAYPDELSGGEKRRVSIARAMVQEPRLIIADEPTNSLDPENTRIIMECFQEVVSQGAAVLISTHDREIAGFQAKRYRMAAGCLAAE